MNDFTLDLTRHADRRILNRHDVRLVLITQRQVQHQIPCGMEVEFSSFLAETSVILSCFWVSGVILKAADLKFAVFYPKTKGRLNVMFQTAFKAEYLKQINI